MPLENYFFTKEPDNEKTLFYSRLLKTRVLLYPSCFLLGEAALTIVGHGMILASVPSLASLLLLSAMTACLLTPIFMALRLLIDNNLTHNTRIWHISHPLLYLLDMFLNIQCIASLTLLTHRPVMNIYALYIILGFGVIPSISICLLVILMMHAHANYTFHNAASNDDDIVSDPEAAPGNEPEDSAYPEAVLITLNQDETYESILTPN